MGRFGGMGGGLRGPMGGGGMPRTFGLHRYFARPEFEGKPPKISRVGLKRIGRYFKPYWLRWFVVVACIAASAGLTVLGPLCVAGIVDSAIPAKDKLLLGLLAGAIVGLAAVVGLVRVLQQTLAVKAGQGMLFDLRNELYRHLQRMSLHFYTGTRSGEIVSRINNDVNAVQGVATNTLVGIVNNIALLTAACVTLFSMNWRLALLAASIVPAFYIPSKVVGRIRRRLSTQTQEAQAGLLAFLSERLHIGGAVLMKIFGQRAADAETFSDHSADVRDLTVKQSVVGRWLFMILTVFSATGPALVWWYGGLQAMADNIKPGQLMAFAMLLGMLYRPLMQLATVYVDIQGAVAVFERIFEYLDMAPRVRDQAEPTPLAGTKGHIVFEGVGFAYPPPDSVFAKGGEPAEGDKTDQFALREVSFEIRPGQRVALVGPSGAGKTTITYLLPRFYDPDAGRITLDGQDLRTLGQEQLRSHIGMVTQETFLFHASIRENLLYARGDASDEQIVAACRAANIHEFIASLPEKYETVAGERGFRLSGGEKQRVSIARALLKDPAVLILDEATSSLDATSEYLIQMALERLLQGRTSLIIAHRLSTILSCDKIVVMDAGRVVDAGRHDELLKRGGLYAELFTQQFGKVLEMNGEGRTGGA